MNGGIFGTDDINLTINNTSSDRSHVASMKLMPCGSQKASVVNGVAKADDINLTIASFAATGHAKRG